MADNEVKIYFAGDTSGVDRAAGEVESRIRRIERTDPGLPFEKMGVAARGAADDLKGVDRQLNSIIARTGPEGRLAANMSRLFGISAGGILTGGVIAAAGYAIVELSKKVREEAEKRLRYEELNAGAINRQVLEQEKGLKTLQEKLRLAERDRELRGIFAEGDPDALRRMMSTLQTLRQGSSGDQAERLDREILQFRAAIAAAEDRRRESLDKAFAQRFRNLQLQQEQERRAERERLADIEKAKKKTEEIAAAWKGLFTNLSVQVAGDNPFVQVFTRSQKAVDDLKERIRGLAPELQTAALSMQRLINARQLFAARVENRMVSFDLREIAARFRDDTEERRRFAQGGLDRTRAEFERLIGLGANVNEQAIEEYLARRQRFIDSRFQGDTPAARLDRQLAALESLDPRETGERAILDQRILNLVSGLDPSDLRGDQRERIAQIAERSAEREERRFQEALEVQRDQLETQRRIDDNQKRLLAIAERSGTAGVDRALNIIVRDESGSAQVERRASPADVSDYYTGQLIGGPGGLTNR